MPNPTTVRVRVAANRTCNPAEIVGLTEIAQRLGVATQTAYSWRKRSLQAPTASQPLPPPDGLLSGAVPWWFWTATVLPWARATERI